MVPTEAWRLFTCVLIKSMMGTVVITSLGEAMMSDDVSDMAHELYEAGRSALDAGDLDVAIGHFERSIAVSPHFKTLELLGEAWLRRGEPRRAVVPLAAATTLNAQVRAPSLLAEALLAAGDPLDAHRIARLALERDPRNKKALAVLEATSAAYRAWSEEQRPGG